MTQKHQAHVLAESCLELWLPDWLDPKIVPRAWQNFAIPLFASLGFLVFMEFFTQFVQPRDFMRVLSHLSQFRQDCLLHG